MAVSHLTSCKDKSAFPMVSASVTGDANADGVLLTLGAERVDLGWSVSDDSIQFSGAPDRVSLVASVYVEGPQRGGLQRVAPKLELLRNGETVAISATGYQRHAVQHSSSSNAINFVDPSPGENPVYSLRSQRGSAQTDVIDVTLGSFSAVASHDI